VLNIICVVEDLPITNVLCAFYVLENQQEKINFWTDVVVTFFVFSIKAEKYSFVEWV
jgi:hypothetical protein